MRDSINQIIEPGSFFLMPDGNPRYGGLKIKLGVVLSMTEKRCKCLISELKHYKPKPTTKTPQKLLIIDTQRFEHLEVFKELFAAFEKARHTFR